MTKKPDADRSSESSGEGATTTPPAQQGASPQEASLQDRESALQARERASLSREDAGDLREDAARAQEDAVRARTALEQLMIEMREVNAHLVEATLRAQTLAEKAEEANRLKDEFLATVSHELRTPLNAVLGWSRILAKRLVQGERADHATMTIERNAAFLAHMIDDLLDVSAATGGNLAQACQPVDLVAVTAAAIDSVEMLADAKKIQILLSSTSQAREPVNGDFGRLQQVIWNLLSNAIKFTPEGGRVDVRVRRGNGDLEIAVIDSGEGIAPDFLPHVFDRFRQADSSTTRRHSGLGLGLAIARQIMEQHHGTIRAESAGPGAGSTFTITVPILGPVSNDRRVTVQSLPDQQPLQRLDRLAILVVEDNADVRELMSTILEHVGARVTTSSSVREAVQALDTFQPDVLITDIGLPDEDGFALIREVRRLESERGGFLPAVALTGFTRAEDRVRTLAAGFQSHLAKPVDPAELTAAIAALARSSRKS
jgi:signal transduction histidine kinase/ActR/RegA family two-component response regulator